MAERRMFTKRVTDDDNFLSLSSSAQALYLHLSMAADDDGFCNQVSVSMFKAHASVQDLEALLDKRFLYQFENGVIVIKHWRMANALRKDRYTPTAFQEELAKLELKDNESYTLATNWQPSGNQLEPQDRLGKDSIGKVNNTVLTDSSSHSSWDKEECIALWNSLKQFGVPALVDIKPSTERGKLFAKRSKQYSMDDYRTAIDNIRHSTFLQGQNDKGWTITFDWFIKPNNFSKVLEGNYAEKNRKNQGNGRNDHIFEMIDRLGLGDD